MKTSRALLVSLCAALAASGVSAQSAPPPTAASSGSAELKRLHDEDQSERTAAPGKVIDWSALMLRDEARQQRVKELIAAGGAQSGADYYHAALVIQHASEPDDHLLAHDLCVIAIAKGEPRAKWLAAASLDRFLTKVGRPQRYGTQFLSNHASRPPKLLPVDPNVPDALRRELGVPTLEEAQATERRMAKDFEAAKAAASGAK
jgi:hypothetical protein